MVLKNNLLVTLLLIFLFVIAILSAATLATQTILGYTGFSKLNHQPDNIRLAGICDNNYLSEKYGVSLVVALRITFICTWVVVVGTGICLVGLMNLFCGCCKN